MQTALILMTILGCDDSATQCHYVEMLDERWATIQECDAVPEERLKDYGNIDYPVVVAVCQTPEDGGLAEVAGEPLTAPDAPLAGTGTHDPSATPQTKTAAAEGVPIPKVDIPAPGAQTEEADASDGTDPGFATRVLERFKAALPEADSLKAIVSEPVHVVTDSYSWVARRFEK